jgi:hypothetical protein
MTNNIVTVNTSLQLAPEPETLQSSGALLSQGGTITAQGTASLLTQLSDLTPLLTPPAAILGISWTGSVATAVIAQAGGLVTGDQLYLTVSAAAPVGYNGTFLATVLGYNAASVLSATYNTSTGILALTFSAAPFGASVGATLDGVEVTVVGLAGSGVAVLNGTWPIASTGTSGTVINLQVTTGLGSLTITGSTGTLQAGVTGFSYPLPAYPGAETTPGLWTPGSVGVLTRMATTFFAQGTGIGVFVLELGLGGPNDGITTLTAYLTANPNTSYIDGAAGYYYSYLIPPSWDNNANFLALVTNYESPTAKTYFWVTTTLATYAAYTALMKCVVAMIDAPAYGQWPANTLTALSYANGQVTATTYSPHGVAVGQWFQIQGCAPVGYNGWAKAVLGTTGSTLIWALATSPGAESVLGTLEASLYASPGVSSTEFSLAADFQHTLNYAPSSTNRVTPNAFAYLYGVTPFPTQGNGALLTTLKAANVNVVGTGAEGGLSNTIMSWGTTKDGNDFQVWYSIDWVQVNSDIVAANVVINGSNDPQNPLYFNQSGINVLQAALASLISQGVSYGLVFGAPVQTELTSAQLAAALAADTYAGLSVVNADPFIDWVTNNPSDYPAGVYGGLSLTYTPQVGFKQIIYDVSVSFFPGQV